VLFRSTVSVIEWKFVTVVLSLSFKFIF